MNNLERYFGNFRRNIAGIDQEFRTAWGMQTIVYADWIASGRLYLPIEERITRDLGPLVGNTHSEPSATGLLMTQAYRRSHEIIKQHVHAGPDDVSITAGFG